MYGAIIGDICGSIYEWDNCKTEQPETLELLDPRCFFTDDTVLTIAVAEALLQERDYQKSVLAWANRHPHESYGGMFQSWFCAKNPKPYNSYGNGSAMRVSPVGWACQNLDEVLYEAKRSAEVTHNHPEGIKGAQAIAAAIFLAQTNSKEDIKRYITETFGYDLNRTLNDIRPHYNFDETCQGTVPEAIIAFLESRDFVHAIQLAISIGGDTDTIACITGSIAEAFYRKIPDEYLVFADSTITDEMRTVLREFRLRYIKTDSP